MAINDCLSIICRQIYAFKDQYQIWGCMQIQWDHLSPKITAKIIIKAIMTFIILSAKALLAASSAASKWITACWVWVNVD